jgi:hypothetical protein
MTSIAAETLSVRTEWGLSRVGFASVVLALLVCGLALGLSIHHGSGERTNSLTPAITSTSP